MDNKTNNPRCVGFIMDGNRRWARERGLPVLEGHRRGFEKLKEVFGWAKDAGIEHIAVYAFSTENWRRTEEEVGFLMNLFRRMLSAAEISEMEKANCRLKFVGDLLRLDEDIRRGIADAERQTSSGTTALWIAISYGGRIEIVSAAERAVRAARENNGAVLTEDGFRRMLWSADMPDMDMIVRTGGELRLSNFFSWQSAYSELFFTKTYWPDFSKEEFDSLCAEFARRERRIGA